MFALRFGQLRRSEGGFRPGRTLRHARADRRPNCRRVEQHRRAVGLNQYLAGADIAMHPAGVMQAFEGVEQ